MMEKTQNMLIMTTQKTHPRTSPASHGKLKNAHAQQNTQQQQLKNTQLKNPQVNKDGRKKWHAKHDTPQTPKK